MRDKIFQEVADGLEKLGILPLSEFKLTQNEIMELSAKALDDIDLSAFEELLERIASYNIFLKSQKGSLEAQLIIIDSELKRLTYLQTQSMDQKNGETWLTKEEKQSLVLSGNEAVKNLYHQSLVLKAKVAKLKDIPFAIDRKLEILKLKYRRRVNEEYRTQS